MNPAVANFNPKEYQSVLLPLLEAIAAKKRWSKKSLPRLLNRYPKPTGLFSKTEIILAYHYFQSRRRFPISEAEFLHRLQKKPVRTQSGVAPVTVLTKPYPCPGECIFCPNDIRMPKSYISSEPGAQRATQNAFDPYLQTYNRILTYAQNGHSVEKAELIVLGGTWSYYPEPYQIWFIKRCFDALNDFSLGQDGRSQVKSGSSFSDPARLLQGADLSRNYNQTISQILKDSGAGERFLNPWERASWQQLQAAQVKNESSRVRCVGLVIETRPDNISPTEVAKIRRLGCTKTQIGFQSLNDTVLSKNKRGHNVQATKEAMALLRQAGLKIHAHWMPNLYGSNPKKDIQDYKKIFQDPAFKPDELKIYPTALIESAELMAYYQKGKWQPYSHSQLLEVLTACFRLTPPYCRLTRVIRDFPSPDIVAGNKKTNFRQITEQELKQQGSISQDIRSREIKARSIAAHTLKLDNITYETATATEHFLQFVTPENHIVGFLRLSLPSQPPFIEELKRSALIREVHVYGQAADLGEVSRHKSQHLGLGKRLIARAREIAQAAGYPTLSVISAVGTKPYYRNLGFRDGPLYQHLPLN